MTRLTFPQLSWRRVLSFRIPENETDKPLKDLRVSWAKTLKKAGLPYFWLYDLRHSLCSRLSQAGVSPIFVAQIIGHASTSILSTYARAIDEYRRDAIHKLEMLRNDHALREANSHRPTNGSVQ